MDSIQTFAGFDMLSGAMKNNSGSCFMNTAALGQALGAAQSPEAIAAELMRQAEETIPDARFIVFSPPPILGHEPDRRL